MGSNQSEHHDHSEHDHEPEHPPVPGGPCPVEPKELVPLTNSGTNLFVGPAVTTTIKVPVVTAEPTLQIVVESTIKLHPAATEIKRVKKNVFLNQVKLVPVAFTRIDNTDFFNVTRGKLFVSGHIRKNIEFASHECKGTLQDRIVDTPFTGFTDITAFTNPPIIGIAETAEANFLNEKTNLDARLDKFFFQNLVKYNEQPFGELVAANFFELDFSPTMVSPEGTFSTLREKIVLDLTLKVLQVQQIRFTASPVVPVLTGLTPPVTP
ncbi:CsxC family protein [Neobacillus massiliamazoniensis]|uniref:DUF7852 domain-containing protein n=1 Tax=Neobacillus massiliamazoniensis TaxID=1499688 RepID=A0A0U1NST0_9BACI|nr:Uracil permease [Neobacillus massiliamazoniensis]CRK81103.1 Hypothetical protein BN000_01001 [Neobacillus massiliamazoniensis]